MEKRKPIHISVKILIMLAMLVTSSQLLVKASLISVQLFQNISVVKENVGNLVTNRHDISGSVYQDTITIGSTDLANVQIEILENSKKYAVLTIPDELSGKVGLLGPVKVDTSISMLTRDLELLDSVIFGPSRLITPLITGVINAVGNTGLIPLVNINKLSDLLVKLTGDTISLTGANFDVAANKVDSNASYISAELDDGIGRIIVEDLLTTLQAIDATLDEISELRASSNDPLLVVVVGAINVALGLLVDAVSSLVLNGVALLVNATRLPELIDEIADASVLGKTSVDFPISITRHQLTTNNGYLNALFNGSIIQSSIIDIDLFDSSSPNTTVYLSNTVPQPPIITSFTGNSKTPSGYTLVGEATPGDTIIVRGPGINTLTPVVVDANGDFTIVIPLPMVQGDILSIIAKRGGLESTPVTRAVPNDPVPTLPSNVVITGNSANGYIISGNGKVGDAITILDDGDNVLTTIPLTTTSFSYNLPSGTEVNDSIKVYATLEGFESAKVTKVVPEDPAVAVPTVTGINGNSIDGYSITGTGIPGQIIVIRNSSGLQIGSGQVDPSGNFNFAFDHATAVADHPITIRALENGIYSAPVSRNLPLDPEVPAPSNLTVTGNSVIGYTLTGTGRAGDSIVLFDNLGNSIALGLSVNATVDLNGIFTFELPTSIVPSQVIRVSATKGGFISGFETTTVPSDPIIAAPSNLSVIGNSLIGHGIRGLAEADRTINAYNSSNVLVGTATTNMLGEFTVSLSETVSIGDTVSLQATDGTFTSGKQSIIIPQDPIINPPVITSITGNSKTGYTITGTSTAGYQLHVENAIENELKEVTVMPNNIFTFTLDNTVVSPGEELTFYVVHEQLVSTEVNAPIPADPIIGVPSNLQVLGNSIAGYTLTGEATAGDTVVVTDGNVSNPITLGSGLVDPDGKFEIELTGSIEPEDILSVYATKGDFNSTIITVEVPDNPSNIPPFDSSIEGNSKVGYVISGKGNIGDTIIVRTLLGTTLGTTAVDGNGDYRFPLGVGSVSPKQELNVFSERNSFESLPQKVTVPDDPQAGLITDKAIAGNSQIGYTISGKGQVGDTITLLGEDDEIIDTTTVNAAGNFEFAVASTAVAIGDDLSLVPSLQGFKGTAVEVTVPADTVTPPTLATNVQITGNTVVGYTVTGRGTVGDKIIITDDLDIEVGNAVVDANGDFTVQIAGSAVSPLEILNLVSERNNLQSTSQEVRVPANPVVTAPSNLSFSGNTLDGVVLRGKGTPGDTIIIRTEMGTQLGTTAVNANGDFEYALQVGSVDQQDILKLIATRGGFSSDEVEVTVPTDPITPPTLPGNVTIEGDSTDGYVIEGEGVAGETIIVRDSDGNDIGTTTVKPDGTFEVSIDPETVEQGEILDVISVKDGVESSPVEVEVPNDSSTLVKPLITQLGQISGNATNGYAVQGLTTDANLIVVTDSQGNIVARITVSARTRSIPLGQFTAILTDANIEPGELLTFSAYYDAVKGNEMQARVPSDATQPTVPNPPTDVNIDGDEDDGYVVDGGGTPGDTIIITDEDGNTIGETIVDEDGRFEVVIKPGVVKPGDKLNVISDRDGVQSDPIVIQVPNSATNPLPGTGTTSVVGDVSLLISMIGLLLILIQKRKEIEANL